MARFKIVKHRLSYHVIGFTGTVKPRNGKKSTYKEQCISSHSRLLPNALERATKAQKTFEESKLQLSNVSESSIFHRFIKELHIGIVIAVIAGFAFEAGIKFLAGGH